MSTMNCEEAKTLLPAYADGELDLPRALALEQHLEGCAECGAALRQLRALKQSVRGAPYHRAPDTLRARLAASLTAAPATPLAAPVATPVRRRRDWSRWSLPIAAALALAVGLNLTLATRRAQDALGAELVDSHVRSLQQDHVADVASTDQHTVKPWFTGKLDYAPPVRDLAAQGFPLEGGRLDYVNHRQVAALIYHRHKHVINLYVWPTGQGDTAPGSQVREGYSLVHWRSGGMEWWAVSDLNGEELQQFAQLLIAAAKDVAANAPNA
jgi:anti-sigma factor RsiW